ASVGSLVAGDGGVVDDGQARFAVDRPDGPEPDGAGVRLSGEFHHALHLALRSQFCRARLEPSDAAVGAWCRCVRLAASGNPRRLVELLYPDVALERSLRLAASHSSIALGEIRLIGR